MKTRAVWAWWLAMLAAPAAALAAARVTLGPLHPMGWSVGTILATAAGGLWLLAAGPTAVMLRSHCFQAAWRGRSLDVESYLRGMLTVWGTLLIAAMIGAAGAVLTDSWLPCALVAAMGTMLIGLLWPTGRWE